MQLQENENGYGLVHTPLKNPIPWYKIFFFSIAIFNSVAQSLWASRELYKGSDTILKIDTELFILIGTLCYTYTNFCSRIDALTRDDDASQTQGKLASFAKIFPYSVALMSAFSILMSCLDPSDSIVSDILPGGSFSFWVLGAILGTIAAVGDFFARVKFYSTPAANNIHEIIKDVKYSYNASWTAFIKQLTINIAYIGFASVSYASFYRFYMVSGTDTIVNDLSIPYVSNMEQHSLKDLQKWLGVAIMFFAGSSNFLSTYKKMSKVLKNPCLLIHITDKENRILPRTVLGTASQLIGLADTAYTLYSGLNIIKDFNPLLAWTVLGPGMFFYALAAYQGFSVNAGSALGTTRLDNHIGLTKNWCCCFANKKHFMLRGRNSQNEHNQDSRQEALVRPESDDLRL